MAAQGPIIVQHGAGLEVKGRRRFSDPKVFEAMLNDLSGRLTRSLDQSQTVVISDLDLSQNKLTTEQFENLFMTLGVSGARVTRFRLFGCATLNDEVMQKIGEHFRTNLTSETAPAEMHLSDCAITTDGFEHFMSALEETDLYPLHNPQQPGKGWPLYLRVENNYISEAAIQARVSSGLVQTFTKRSGAKMSEIGGPKVNLVVLQENGNCPQKQGQPPAPENAPPPKSVNDKFSQQQQAVAGQAMQNQQWMARAWMPHAAPAMALPHMMGYGQQMARPMNAWGPGFQANAMRPQMGAMRPQMGMQRPQMGMQRPNMAQGMRPAMQQSQQNAAAWGQKGCAAGKGATNAAAWPRAPMAGNAGTAADRSRTPAPRNTKPASGMPKPWEEHFSDEYKIPYYWNSETGEALWEKPSHWN